MTNNYSSFCTKKLPFFVHVFFRFVHIKASGLFSTRGSIQNWGGLAKISLANYVFFCCKIIETEEERNGIFKTLAFKNHKHSLVHKML